MEVVEKVPTTKILRKKTFKKVLFLFKIEFVSVPGVMRKTR